MRHLANATGTLGGIAVSGIFDNAYQLAGVGGNGFASSQPSYALPSSSLTGDPTGLALVVNAISYTVVAAEPDGTGITVLMLEKA